MTNEEIKNEKLSEALKKIRDLYPDDSLGDAIIMAVDRIKKAEERCKKLNSIASEAQQRAYEFDKRYCDILVHKKQQEQKIKALKKALNAVYGTRDEEMTFVDINKLEELEK